MQSMGFMFRTKNSQRKGSISARVYQVHFFFSSIRPISRFIHLLVFSEIRRAILVKLDSSAWHCADLLFIQYEACTNHNRQNGTGRRPLIGYYASALSTYSQCIARCSMFTGITPAKSTMQTSTGGCGMHHGA